VGESGGVGFLERDQAAGELEEREVVRAFLRPADQERQVAVEPGVAGLDDPPPCAPSRFGSLELELLGAAADVGAVAASGGEVVDAAGRRSRRRGTGLAAGRVTAGAA
jgi:hypothetical protein